MQCGLQAMHTFAARHARDSTPAQLASDDKSVTVQSDMMTVDGKMFYLDLIDNNRGRVMKVWP